MDVRMGIASIAVWLLAAGDDAGAEAPHLPRDVFVGLKPHASTHTNDVASRWLEEGEEMDTGALRVLPDPVCARMPVRRASS